MGYTVSLFLSLSHPVSASVNHNLPLYILYQNEINESRVLVYSA